MAVASLDPRAILGEEFARAQPDFIRTMHGRPVGSIGTIPRSLAPKRLNLPIARRRAGACGPETSGAMNCHRVAPPAELAARKVRCRERNVEWMASRQGLALLGWAVASGAVSTAARSSGGCVRSARFLAA